MSRSLYKNDNIYERLYKQRQTSKDKEEKIDDFDDNNSKQMLE